MGRTRHLDDNGQNCSKGLPIGRGHAPLAVVYVPGAVGAFISNLTRAVAPVPTLCAMRVESLPSESPPTKTRR